MATFKPWVGGEAWLGMYIDVLYVKMFDHSIELMYSCCMEQNHASSLLFEAVKMCFKFLAPEMPT